MDSRVCGVKEGFYFCFYMRDNKVCLYAADDNAIEGKKLSILRREETMIVR